MSGFDLEEILPDIDVGTVRLPRRQVGVSPQGTTVTMVADYCLRSRAWLPSGAIVALLGAFEVTQGGARTVISRLARRGVLENQRSGRSSFYRLTEQAAFALAFGGQEIAAFAGAAEDWDGRWTLIAFSLPKEEDTQRRALRGRLRWLGYAPLYDGLWISPYRLPEPAAKGLAEISRGALTVFRARRIDLAGVSTRPPLEAWDMAGISDHYKAFVHQWRPLVPRIRCGDVGGAEALRARTLVMDSYRRFKMLDPRLPMDYMPEGWLREQARDAFTAVYDGLAGPALRHVLDTVARYTDVPDPGIGTHTVADLLAGLHPALAGPTPAS